MQIEDNSHYKYIPHELDIMDEEYIPYECPICGSILVCAKDSWEYHFKLFPESESLCNGDIQRHVVTYDEKRYFGSYSRGTHPTTLMKRIKEWSGPYG